MADKSDGWKDPLAQNDVFKRINPRIFQILTQLGCRPEGDIIDDLTQDIDDAVLEECRDTLFKESTTKFEHGLAGKPNLELKL